MGHVEAIVNLDVILMINQPSFMVNYWELVSDMQILICWLLLRVVITINESCGILLNWIDICVLPYVLLSVPSIWQKINSHFSKHVN